MMAWGFGVIYRPVVLGFCSAVVVWCNQGKGSCGYQLEVLLKLWGRCRLAEGV
jgi:hypothetical protein